MKAFCMDAHTERIDSAEEKQAAFLKETACGYARGLEVNIMLQPGSSKQAGNSKGI